MSAFPKVCSSASSRCMLAGDMAQTVSGVLACQLALSYNVVVLLKGLLVDPLVKHHLNALLISHLQCTCKMPPENMRQP